MKFVVGTYSDWEAFRLSRRLISYTECFHHLHPREFEAKVEELQMKYSENVFTWINNPLILDWVDADDVIVLYGDKFKTLDQHPKFDQWKEEMSSGELWSFFGEEWVSQ